MAVAHDTDQSETARPIDLEAGRRAFFQALGLGAAGASLVAATAAEAATRDIDVPILNFALNLEYLEASFYLQAAFGRGLTNAESTGVGTLGAVTGGRKVNFQNPIVADYAQEIANDEENHVRFLRTALGGSAIARPALNIGTAFTVAAQAAGVVGAGQTFDPYADDVSFLLGAYIFEDVGVTAYSGAAAYIKNKDYLSAAASILTVEAYHAGLVRTFLLAQQSHTVNKTTALISALRANLSRANDDQGIGPNQSTLAGGPRTPANIAPTDANGLAFTRTPRQVLNVVYGKAGAAQGLFFPQGVNRGPEGGQLIPVTSNPPS